MIKIVIGGDVCPVGRNLPLFEKGDARALMNDILGDFAQADLSIVNLECPLIREDSPTDKIGPNLGVAGTCVNGLQAVGVDVVGLANNHIIDRRVSPGRDISSRECALKYVPQFSLVLPANYAVKDFRQPLYGLLAEKSKMAHLHADNGNSKL